MGLIYHHYTIFDVAEILFRKLYNGHWQLCLSVYHVVIMCCCISICKVQRKFATCSSNSTSWCHFKSLANQNALVVVVVVVVVVVAAAAAAAVVAAAAAVVAAVAAVVVVVAAAAAVVVAVVQ